jgi:CTP:molybdopterin cytidylyltransferase MocA
VNIGIVLAAGMGRRIGAPKALLRLDGRTFLERAVESLRGAGLEVVAVMNPVVDEGTKDMSLPARRIRNEEPDHPSGMFGSVRLGVNEGLKLGARAAVLLPVDLPLVTSDDVRAVLQALSAEAAIAVGTHEGRWGHPIAINRRIMEEVMAAGPTGTLREIVRKDRTRVAEVEVSEGAILGINTREDLERASNRSFR